MNCGGFMMHETNGGNTEQYMSPMTWEADVARSHAKSFDVKTTVDVDVGKNL